VRLADARDKGRLAFLSNHENDALIFGEAWRLPSLSYGPKRQYIRRAIRQHSPPRAWQVVGPSGDAPGVREHMHHIWQERGARAWCRRA
jgi:hypothetical protein